jgi:hypothetical protein
VRFRKIPCYRPVSPYFCVYLRRSFNGLRGDSLLCGGTGNFTHRNRDNPPLEQEISCDERQRAGRISKAYRAGAPADYASLIRLHAAPFVIPARSGRKLWARSPLANGGNSNPL